MAGDELGQRVQRSVPIAPGLVRKHRGHALHAAGVVHHRHLDAGADAGVQPHRHTLAGGRGKQQVSKVVGEDLDRSRLGGFTQAREQIALQAQ